MNYIMKKTKLTFLTFFAAVLAFSFSSIAQIETPSASPAGSASAKVGLTDVEINYFRPQLKGRKIFGKGEAFLLQFDELWRAGANSGTKVKFSTDVKVGGKDLKAGEYLLLAKPGASEWSIIFYTDLSLGGNMSGYDESKSAAIVAVKPGKLTEAVNTLTYNVSDLSEDGTGANLELAWENTSVKVPVTVSFDETVMKAIAENTKVSPGNLISAAWYYFNNDKDIDQALEWVNTYLEDESKKSEFWNTHLKAQILAKKGDKKNAIKAANESMEMAKANEGGDFGYIKRNEDLIASFKK
jgi:hypothetical protein